MGTLENEKTQEKKHIDIDASLKYRFAVGGFFYYKYPNQPVAEILEVPSPTTPQTAASTAAL
eukprot:GDKH01010035.1.p1 GENE.GDKH01010035.1~~GDKH01010035.1.p1  ORF type:complete len:62 (+),score=11.47 GDKH01010035.1:1-186(+)